MKYKLMYVVLLLLLLILVGGRAVCLAEINIVSTEKKISKINPEIIISEDKEEEKKIVGDAKTEIDNYTETFVEEKKESMLEKSNNSILKGDINEDGKLSITDLSQLNKYIILNKEIEKNKIDFADINNDGKISITDISELNKIILNK